MEPQKITSKHVKRPLISSYEQFEIYVGFNPRKILLLQALKTLRQVREEMARLQKVMLKKRFK